MHKCEHICIYGITCAYMDTYLHICDHIAYMRPYTQICVHMMDQLDKTFSYTALRRTRLSHHRPLSFACRKNEKKQEDNPILNQHILRNKSWATRVAAELGEYEKQQDCANPFRRLVLVKRAMRRVTENMGT